MYENVFDISSKWYNFLVVQTFDYTFIYCIHRTIRRQFKKKKIAIPKNVKLTLASREIS